MPSVRPRRWGWLALVAAAAVIAIVVWISSARRSSRSAAAVRVARGQGARPAPFLFPTNESLDVRIATALNALRRADSGGETAGALAGLRATLSALPADVAVANVRQLLDSGADAPTGSGFEVGGDGFLTSAPSLRVFLLDYLALVDPQAAAEYAVKILGSPDNADEWAVALRSYAAVNDSPDGRRFVREKLEAMIRHDPWRNDPSVGFLEAFDAAVWLGGTELLPLLGDCVRDTGNAAVAHAAFLALDRLAIDETEVVLARLQREPELLAGREATRANYVARADLRQKAQREWVEAYLLDPARGAAELKAFAGVFPNANFMVSHNLLSRIRPIARAELIRRDRAALDVVEQWLADPRFERLRPQLLGIETRLRAFVDQAGRQNRP